MQTVCSYLIIVYSSEVCTKKIHFCQELVHKVSYVIALYKLTFTYLLTTPMFRCHKLTV